MSSHLHILRVLKAVEQIQAAFAEPASGLSIDSRAEMTWPELQSALRICRGKGLLLMQRADQYELTDEGRIYLGRQEQPEDLATGKKAKADGEERVKAAVKRLRRSERGRACLQGLEPFLESSCYSLDAENQAAVRELVSQFFDRPHFTLDEIREGLS